MASEAGETLSRNDRQDQSRRMFRMFGIVIQRLVSLLHARRSQDRFSRVEIPVKQANCYLPGFHWFHSIWKNRNGWLPSTL